jgi:hypothetical protein
MKTRRLLTLAGMALASFLAAATARAGAPCQECDNGARHGHSAKHGHLRNHLQAMCNKHRACSQHACTPGRANCMAQQHAMSEPWNGDYYHVMWGEPVALVSPPRMSKQTHWNWGVSQTAITPVWHQYTRAYPGPFVAGGKGFAPTPRWPSSTDQFGVYYVRGPW